MPPDESAEESGRQPLSRLATQLQRIADSIERHQPDATVLADMAQAETSCGEAAGRQGAVEEDDTLAQLKMVLQTWQSVWARLGHQRDFRQAVVREALRWSKRLQAVTGQAPSADRSERSRG